MGSSARVVMVFCTPYILRIAKLLYLNRGKKKTNKTINWAIHRKRKQRESNQVSASREKDQSSLVLAVPLIGQYPSSELLYVSVMLPIK